MRSRPFRCGRAALAVALSASIVLAGSPLAYAAGSSATSDDAASDSTAQERWSDHIDEMVASGDYNDGEVIAIVAPSAADASAVSLACVEGDVPDSALAGSLLDEASEEISRTTGDVYEETFDEALPEAALEGAQVQALAASGDEDEAAPVEASDVDVYTLVVKREGMTSEEILRALADDPRVLWAEPNHSYTVPGDGATSGVDDEEAQLLSTSIEDDGAAAAADSGSDGSGSSAGGSSADKVTSVTPDTSNVVNGNDVSDWQWAYSDAEGAFGTKHADGFTVSLDGWNDPSSKNSSGVVAVVDTGVDASNPDLAGVMYDMSSLVSEVGGGTYGYNAVNGAEETDVSDPNGHGTHCAGIIAAQWNGYGVSGAANGAELLGVRVADQVGHMSDSSILRGYAYLERAIDAGVDLRAVNNSWGSPIGSRAIWLAVQSLGRKGAVSVFASGNESVNTDLAAYTGKSLTDLPYVVVVSSSSMSGKVSSFSNYGETTSNVFAPGATILSTASSATSANAGGIFLPQAIDEQDRALFETFDSADCGLQAYVAEASDCLTAKATVGHVDTEGEGFDGKGVYRISANELAAAGIPSFGAVTFKVPVDKGRLGELSDFSIAIGAENGSKGADGTVGATIVGLKASGGYQRLGGMKSITTSTTETWTQVNVDVDGAIAGLNDGTGLAVFEDENGGAYIVLNVVVNTMACGSDGDILIDCISAGNKTVPYVYMSGTSMATPCVTGLAMVAANQIEGYGEMGAASRAAELVGVLKGSVNTFDGQFKGLCTSNGMIDAGRFSDSAGRAPVLTSVALADDEATFTLTGTGFGEAAGTVKVSGKDAEVVSWSGTEVVVKRPSGLVSGYLKFTVARADGASCQLGSSALFTKDVSADEVPSFEEAIELPEELRTYNQYCVMAALDGSIYAFPAVGRDLDSTTQVGQESAACYKAVWRYDTEAKTWTEAAELPEWLGGLSITLWEGKMLVLASAPTKDYGGFAAKRLYQYDPEADAWADLSEKVADESVPHQAALVNTGERLLLIGGSKISEIPEDEAEAEKLGVWVPSLIYNKDLATSAGFTAPTLLTMTTDNVRELDLDAGTAKVIGTCEPRCNAGESRSSCSIQTALCGNKLYLYAGATVNITSPATDTDQTLLECLTLGEDGSVSSSKVGDYLGEGVENLPPSSSTFMLGNGLTATKSGPVLSAVVGVDEKSGEFIQDDTYVLADGASAFKSLGKRVNITPTLYSRALAYRGKLYVIGGDFDDRNGLIMRATAVETDELPGDVERKADPEPMPDPDPTPDPDPKSSGGSGNKQVNATKTKIPATGDPSLLGILASLLG